MRKKPTNSAAVKKRPGRGRKKPGPTPKLQLSEALLEQLRALGSIQATIEECAAVLLVSERTLTYFFAAHPAAKEAHADGKRQGLVSLRRKQFAMAEKNAAMAIWLGKQYLGQREPVQQIQTAHMSKYDYMSDEELEAYSRELDQKIEEYRSTEPIKLTPEVRRIANGHDDLVR